MKFIQEYIADFLGTASQHDLGTALETLRAKYTVSLGGDPVAAFPDFVRFYNWLGEKTTKKTFDINSNLARNLPGTLMQDWLIQVVLTLTAPLGSLFVLTEVRVPFGSYPIWESGDVKFMAPGERSDIAVGYLVETTSGKIVKKTAGTSKDVFYSKDIEGHSVLPLVTVNSKIRVSQSEFFDWQGREQLMTKGNPHCLSAQVALRKEMDFSIVEASQASDKFFLIGNGSETTVLPDEVELQRMIGTIRHHLNEHMTSKAAAHAPAAPVTPSIAPAPVGPAPTV